MRSGPKKIWIQPYTHLENMKFGLLSFDFNIGKAAEISTEFEVHNIFYDRSEDEFIAVNSYGDRYLKFKDASFRGIKNYFVNENFVLSGHVASNPSERKYYMTAVLKATGESCIVALDKKSGKFELAAMLGLADPPAHDCKFAFNSSEFITTSDKSIHFYDTNSKVLRNKKLELCSSKSVVRHFSVSRENEICLQSNIISPRNPVRSYQDAQVAFVAREEVSSFLAGSVRAELKNAELLDFSFDSEGKMFAAVHGETPYLTIWNTSPLRPVKTLKFDENICRVSAYFGEPYFLVLGLENFYLIDVKTFAVSRVERFQQKLSKAYQYSHQLILS